MKLAVFGATGRTGRSVVEQSLEAGHVVSAVALANRRRGLEDARGLAGKGHVKHRAEDGIMAYALPDRGRRPEQGMPSALSGPRSEGVGVPERLDDPLSERELEVLALLASGRTNAEIAKDLFVAVGTVKSHVNNIYRKLGAANRAEAVTRAREMHLLG